MASLAEDFNADGEDMKSGSGSESDVDMDVNENQCPVCEQEFGAQDKECRSKSFVIMPSCHE